MAFGIELTWGFPANTDDTLKTEIQYSLTGTEDFMQCCWPMCLTRSANISRWALKAGQIFWYRAQLVDRSGNESGYTEWVRGSGQYRVGLSRCDPGRS